MRPLLAFLALVTFCSPRVRAAVDVDPTLQQGLNALASQTNGIQAACQIWYQDRPHLAADMEARLFAVSKDLGTAFGADVLGVQHLAGRDDRYFIVLYFERHPVWMLIERYLGKDVGKDKPYFLALKVSMEADDILPGGMVEVKE